MVSQREDTGMALGYDFFRCFAGTRLNRPDWDELGRIYGEETQPLDMQDDTSKSNLRANYETSQECSRAVAKQARHATSLKEH